MKQCATAPEYLSHIFFITPTPFTVATQSTQSAIDLSHVFWRRRGTKNHGIQCSINQLYMDLTALAGRQHLSILSFSETFASLPPTA